MAQGTHTILVFLVFFHGDYYNGVGVMRGRSWKTTCLAAVCGLHFHSRGEGASGLAGIAMNKVRSMGRDILCPSTAKEWL